MKLIILGSGGSEGIPVPYCDCRVCKSREKRLRTSYLIKIKDKNLLVEIGPDFRQQQLKYKFPIDYLFISHVHDDHIRGLIELRHILLIAKIKMKRIRLLISPKLHKRILAERLSEPMKADEKAIERESVRYAYRRLLKKRKVEDHILKYYRQYNFKDFSILLFKDKHGNTFTDGFLLESGNKKLFYLGDANKIGEKIRKIIEEEKPDLLIANTPYFYASPPNEKKKDHIGIETLKGLKVKKILMSHFSHKAGLTHKDIRKRLARYRNIIAAYDGMELKI